MQILVYKNMRAEDGHVPFYFSPQLLFCYSFNTNTTAVSEPVVHLIRKNYIHMSWGGGHNRGLPCIILPPRREQIQQFCNIITIFYIATSQRRRDEAWETFPGGVIKVQGCRGEKCSVSDMPGWLLSVKGDELSLCAAQHSLGSLLLLLGRQLLLLLLWAARGSHLVNTSAIEPKFSLFNEV